MKRIYIPTTSPDDWRQFLADPAKQWRSGYSARELAECWEGAKGFPRFGAASRVNELVELPGAQNARLYAGWVVSQPDISAAGGAGQR